MECPHDDDAIERTGARAELREMRVWRGDRLVVLFTCQSALKVGAATQSDWLSPSDGLTSAEKPVIGEVNYWPQRREAEPAADVASRCTGWSEIGHRTIGAPHGHRSSQFLHQRGL